MTTTYENACEYCKHAMFLRRDDGRPVKVLCTNSEQGEWKDPIDMCARCEARMP